MNTDFHFLAFGEILQPGDCFQYSDGLRVPVNNSEIGLIAQGRNFDERGRPYGYVREFRAGLTKGATETAKYQPAILPT